MASEQLCICGAAVFPRAVGIDSLYLNAFIDGLGINWEALRFEKEKLKLTHGVTHAEVTLGGETFALHRAGLHLYPLKLSNKAFTLGLSENMSPHCHAQFSSHLLWTTGLDAAFGRFCAMWENVGARMTRPEIVNRVDAAFDFQIGASDFTTSHFVSQAVKDATWRENQKDQSYQFGRGDVVCRVYDKVAEIEQQSGKAWLFDIWGVREGVWRCEFQMRGERLKQYGIGTLDQMKAYLPSAVRHLARNHTSLRKPGKDSNRSRWPLHLMWHALLESADQLTQPPNRPPPPLLRGSEYLLSRQIKSLLGDFKALAALLSEKRPDDPVSREELIERLTRLTDPYHSPQLWRSDVAAKIRKRELGL